MAQASNRSLLALIGVVLVGMTGFGVFLPVFPFLALHVTDLFLPSSCSMALRVGAAWNS
jgi:uncharacterized membrane protein YbaN (DUF454 family)